MAATVGPHARIERVCSRPDDDDVREMLAIGRVKVWLVGRHDPIDAVLMASNRERNLGDRFAVFFEPSSGKLVAMPWIREAVAS